MTAHPEKGDPTPTTRAPDAVARYDGYDDPNRRDTVISVFGGASRTGPWAPPEEILAVAGFGNVVLDFRQADLPAGTTFVSAFALFGSVEIRVPESLEVELSGLALIGNVVHRSDRTGRTRRKLRHWLRMSKPAPRAESRADDEAVLSVRGTACFGNVVVKVV